MRALAQQEVTAIQQRYEAAIATLSALLQSHAQLEKGKALSIANVERVLARLDASLNAAGPTPQQQAQGPGQVQQQQQQQQQP
jgi:hypothetical protein